MKETYFDFKKLDLNPRIISAAKQNGLLSSEGVLYGCSRHCQPGRQLPHADHRQLVEAVAALYCPVRLTVLELLQQEQKSPATFSSGCPVLDAAVGGVLRGGSVLEVCGEGGVGKTQLALSVAVNSARPTSLGGRGAKVAYVCTEGQFPSSRLRQMSEAMASSLAANPAQRHDVIAGSILVQHVDDLGSLVACVEHQLPAVVARHKVGVVVVDSVAAPLRAAEHLRWTDRQAALHRLGYGLQRLAANSSCLILALNQVSARIERSADLYGLGEECEVLPALGLAWSNLVTSRVLLHRAPSAAVLPGEEADSLAIFGEAPEDEATLSSTDEGQGITRRSDQGSLLSRVCLDRPSVLQGSTTLCSQKLDMTNTPFSFPSNSTLRKQSVDATSSALHECKESGSGSCGGGEACSDENVDREGRTFVKRARVVRGSELFSRHGFDPAPRVMPPTTASDTSRPQQPALMETSREDCALRSTTALDGPPPSSVRTLQVVACPWVPRRSVNFVVRREGVKGV